MFFPLGFVVRVRQLMRGVPFGEQVEDVFHDFARAGRHGVNYDSRNVWQNVSHPHADRTWSTTSSQLGPQSLKAFRVSCSRIRRILAFIRGRMMGGHSHMGEGWQHENGARAMAFPFSTAP